MSTGGNVGVGGFDATGGAMSTGGTTSIGGTTAIVATSCTIDATFYVKGAPNPMDPCQSCQPGTSSSNWSDTPTAGCNHAIAAGLYRSCAVMNGSAFCWGDNLYGQLGNNDGTHTGSTVPVQVYGLTAGITAIAADGQHGCAVANGAAYCWGANYYGMLGNNSTINSDVPVPVSGLTAGVTAIATGSIFTCALVNGNVSCWGYDDTASPQIAKVPVKVSGLPAGVTAIAAGGFHDACAIANGSAYCWGSNAFGQVGNNTTSDESPVAQVQGLPAGVTAIATGGNGRNNSDHACAIVNGSAYCWGHNNVGQLGNNSQKNSSVPVQVSGLTSGVTDIDVDDYHSCAIVNGSVYCWGANGYGQLGNDLSKLSLVPVKVEGLPAGVTAVSAGGAETCALVDGSAYCWGMNGLGQLGNNSTKDSALPVKVLLP
jgi:alpha-tubulin suppressor-like RCC1 family protein